MFYICIYECYIYMCVCVCACVNVFILVHFSVFDHASMDLTSPRVITG